jgi:hypothetical protein
MGVSLRLKEAERGSFERERERCGNCSRVQF